MLLVVIAFVVLMLMGMPVAFAIAISGTLFFLQNLDLPVFIPVQVTVSQTQNFALLAIPLFILAGNFLNKAGITARLLTLATVLAGRMRGGLAQVSVVLSALMGGVSGSAIADASMQSRMLGHEMVRRGMSRGFAAGVLSFGSLLTPVFLPLVRSLGGDPVHFGIVFIIAATIGNFTPPVGAAMYAVCSIMRVPVGEYTIESLPLLAAVSAATLLLILLPGAVTFVPDLIFGPS